MAYKGGTVIISIPISKEDNQKLYELCEKLGCKSKTQLASAYLREKVNLEYEKFIRE